MQKQYIYRYWNPARKKQARTGAESITKIGENRYLPHFIRDSLHNRAFNTWANALIVLKSGKKICDSGAQRHL